MPNRCHNICEDIISFELKYGLRRKTRGTWDSRWEGHRVYEDKASRYCSTCEIFLKLIVGKGEITSEEQAIRCPCCKCPLRTVARNRRDRKKGMTEPIHYH